MAQAEREYVTLDYVSQAVNIKKGSLYYYLRELGIKTYKFPLNRHAHITKEDMELIREAKESPWKINQLKHAKKGDSQDVELPGVGGVEFGHTTEHRVPESVC